MLGLMESSGDLEMADVDELQSIDNPRKRKSDEMFTPSSLVCFRYSIWLLKY